MKYTTLTLQGVTVHVPEGATFSVAEDKITVNDVTFTLNGSAGATPTERGRTSASRKKDKWAKKAVAQASDKVVAAVVADLERTEGYIPYSVLADRHGLSPNAVSIIARDAVA